MGGIITIDVIRASDVTFMPDPVDGVIYTQPTIKPGAGFVRWTVGYQSAGFNGKSKASREGTSRENEIRFAIPLDRKEVRTMLERAEFDTFIVIYRYATGPVKIFGTPDLPVSFQFEHSSGTSAVEQNINNCRFYYSGPENTFFFDSETPTAPGGSPPAIVKVNGDVVATLQPGDVLEFDTDFDFDFNIVGT